MMTVSDEIIDPRIRGSIEAELQKIEQMENARILLAVESGSRAWGFPSLDSDYDVRFIYQRTIEDYLTVLPRRDVIEAPVEGALDISGWDIRKALGLLVRSNPALLEWLTSPIRYHESGEATAQLLDMARATADLGKLAYHYDQLARRSLGNILASDGVAGLKTYCYAVRSALALRWLRGRREMPPVSIRSLIAGLSLESTVSKAIDDLLLQKAQGVEQDRTLRIPVLDRFIASALTEPVHPIRSSARSGVAAKADALFASIMLGECKR